MVENSGPFIVTYGSCKNRVGFDSFWAGTINIVEYCGVNSHCMQALLHGRDTDSQAYFNAHLHICQTWEESNENVKALRSVKQCDSLSFNLKS